MPWLISHFPELQHLEPDQRAQLLKSIPPWTYFNLVARATVSGLLVSAFCVFPFTHLRFNDDTIPRLMLAMLPIAIIVAMWTYRSDLNKIRRAMRREIALAFAGQRTPFCFSCGYDLRNLPGENCPECGEFIGDP